MKLNLGCGTKRLDGWVNVDLHPPADRFLDLELIPWPWPDNSVEAVQMVHVLEHLGETKRIYLGIIKELYRVCRAGAEIRIVVPHPRHDDFLNDPTHVRAVTAESFLSFSRRQNLEWERAGFSNTPLAAHLGVDFEVVSGTNYLDKDMTIKQVEVVLRVVK